jgi:transglutaminase-like putative cysteine protease
MRLEIRHRTHYAYAAPVRDSFNELHLQPVSNDRQQVEAFFLKILPSTRLRHYHDFYANCVHHFELADPHPALTIESHLRVTTRLALGALPLDARPATVDRLPETWRTSQCHDFIQASRYVDTAPETWRLAVDAVDDETDIWQRALRLMGFVHRHLVYESLATQAHTHSREVLAQRRGVCQDFAHVMLSLCRCLRIPARYVSGYLATEIASATHAWLEVYIPDAGWQALDPTHNRPIDETYVTIAVGRDYADVAPVRGTYKGTTEHLMSVEVQVEQRD